MTPATAPGTAAAPAADHMLDDVQVARFLARGYHLIDMSDLTDVHAKACAFLDRFVADGHPHGGTVPNDLFIPIWHDPRAIGAARSLFGDDVSIPQQGQNMHCHCNPPGKESVWTHRDSYATAPNLHRFTYFICFYFPHDITPEMGPTIIFPESHLRGGSVNLIKHYMNIRGQVPMIGKAGMFAITDGSLWHGSAPNKSNRHRYLIKGHYGRRSDPTGPTWNHDPERLSEAMAVLANEAPTPLATRERVRLLEMRRRAWRYMTGQAAEA